jgi:hypothetical protein
MHSLTGSPRFCCNTKNPAHSAAGLFAPGVVGARPCRGL